MSTNNSASPRTNNAEKQNTWYCVAAEHSMHVTISLNCCSSCVMRRSKLTCWLSSLRSSLQPTTITGTFTYIDASPKKISNYKQIITICLPLALRSWLKNGKGHQPLTYAVPGTSKNSTEKTKPCRCKHRLKPQHQLFLTLPYACFVCPSYTQQKRALIRSIIKHFKSRRITTNKIAITCIM